MRAVILDGRSILRITGEDARRFLEGVITNDVDSLEPGGARFAALLTPQGKVIADFFLVAVAEDEGGGFLIDAPRPLAEELAKKLGFYKLRAKVNIEPRLDLAVAVVLEGEATEELGIVFADPRHPGLGQRVILPAAEAAADLKAAGFAPASEDDWRAKRIALGIPEGGRDFVYGDAYPHEILMDQLNGVAFDKGCFIGQEVVSRMERKTTPRTRIVPVTFDAAPIDGVEVRAGEKPAGHMGSSANGRGLAMIRLDRVAAAMAKGEAVTAGGIPLVLQKPDWARFKFPGEPDFGT